MARKKKSEPKSNLTKWAEIILKTPRRKNPLCKALDDISNLNLKSPIRKCDDAAKLALVIETIEALQGLFVHLDSEPIDPDMKALMRAIQTTLSSQVKFLQELENKLNR